MVTKTHGREMSGLHRPWEEHGKRKSGKPHRVEISKVQIFPEPWPWVMPHVLVNTYYYAPYKTPHVLPNWIYTTSLWGGTYYINLLPGLTCNLKRWRGCPGTHESERPMIWRQPPEETLPWNTFILWWQLLTSLDKDESKLTQSLKADAVPTEGLSKEWVLAGLTG